MTDLEMTKLCAEAMGYKVSLRHTFDNKPYWMHDINSQSYEPLIDNAEAMALAKKLHMSIWHVSGNWRALSELYIDEPSWHSDLNQAICFCAAKMQSAK